MGVECFFVAECGLAFRAGFQVVHIDNVVAEGRGYGVRDLWLLSKG